MRVALVDCNNFYVSCERAFNPGIRDVPVVVLSNNDGCIISRSAEAKALGVRMGHPYHEIRDLVQKGYLHCFSSNYPLYGDMSQRVMSTLETFSPAVEPYSIDEAFLSLYPQGGMSYTDQGRKIRETVGRWTGIPVSVGMAATKTLAKIAADMAKKHPDGAVDLATQDLDRILAETPVEGVWGVGRRLGKRLRNSGITDARTLRDVDDRWARSKLNVVQRRTIMELRGTPCITVDSAPVSRQSLIWTRSFGRKLTEKEPVFEAVAAFAARVGFKLRKRKLAASYLYVFASVRGSGSSHSSYSGSSVSASCMLPSPTSGTPELVRCAHELLERCFVEGQKYFRAGVVAHGLVPESSLQTNLFSTTEKNPSETRAMQAMDRINRRWGKEILSVAAAGTQQLWKMKQERLSPRYTTNWDEISVFYPLPNPFRNAHEVEAARTS